MGKAGNAEKMIWSIVLCYMGAATVFAAEETFRSSYFVCRNNRRLADQTVITIHSPSLLSCSRTCLKLSWCTSTNFKESFGRSSKGNCELNRHEVSPLNDVTQLTDTPGSTFTLVLKGCLLTGCLNGSPCLFDKQRQTFACSFKQPWNEGKCELEFNATFTCDNSLEIFADGKSLGNDTNWVIPTTYLVPGNTRVLSVAGKDWGSYLGILGSTSNGLVTNESWKCSSVLYPGWNSPDFDDKNWPSARVVGKHCDPPWGEIKGIDKAAKWIWADSSNTAYCRLNLK